MNLSEYSRRVAHEVCVGNVKIGSNYPIAVQSMTNTDTHNVEATVAQIRSLEKAGCDIVRVTVPTIEDAKYIDKIKEKNIYRYMHSLDCRSSCFLCVYGQRFRKSGHERHVSFGGVSGKAFPCFSGESKGDMRKSSTKKRETE